MGFLKNIGKAALSGVTGLVSGFPQTSLDLFGSAQNYKRSKALNRQRFEYNKKLSELAFDQNLQLWNVQNEYNTPEQQVARLRAAGVNPALAFGSGNLTGNADQAPELAYADYNPSSELFDMHSPIATSLQSSQLSIAREQMAADVDLKYGNLLKVLEDAGVSKTTRQFLEATLNDRIAQEAFRTSTMGQDLEIARRRVTELDLSNKEKTIVLSYLDQYQQIGLALQRSQVALNETQVKKIDKEIEKLGKEGELLEAQINRIAETLKKELEQYEANISLLRSGASVNSAKAREIAVNEEVLRKTQEQVTATTEKIKAETQITQLEAQHFSWMKIAQSLGLLGSAAAALMLAVKKPRGPRPRKK